MSVHTDPWFAHTAVHLDALLQAGRRTLSQLRGDADAIGLPGDDVNRVVALRLAEGAWRQRDGMLQVA